ncbi:MAG: FAD-binding oxidoreductase [Myxococcota bacterium]|nr:FAD-binding oxidoreductase [Myxococcota bacterium]
MGSERPDLRTPSGGQLAQGRLPDRIVPGDPPSDGDDAISRDVWGFRDTAFTVSADGVVRLSGSRYELSGQELPDVLPWMCEQIGALLSADDRHPSQYPPQVPEPRPCPAFLEEVRKFLPEDAIETDALERLRHGHGHTQEEMWAIKYERLERVPDLIVLPQREEDVDALVEAAERHGVCLIPYGGGTNVTDALRCPPDEERPIVSVDLARLNRILWIDPTNLMARVQAGAVGRHLVEQLAEYGFTMGHEPDSIEFSTLGGWIATHASGMKKNRYGNIEDLVLDVRVSTPRGVLSREAVGPRESVGADARRWIFGSEGRLGIVTSAVVKLFPLPEVQRYDAILFPSFEQGVAFLYDLMREAAPPASVRLVDNLQFQLSQTLKPRATGAKALVRRLEKLYVTRLRGFDPDRMVACTLVYEGSRSEVEAQEAAAKQLFGRHGGMQAGAENGKRGYQLTFGIAYIRDFIMKHHLIAESFETSVPWSQALALCENVKRRVREEHAKRGLPGKPFITCRVTQLYQTGVCIYFYFAIYSKGVANASETYAELERCARDEILRSGGSLSHHHGVGKLRGRFLSRIWSPAALDWIEQVKRAVDPGDVFGCANQRPGSEPETAGR